MSLLNPLERLAFLPNVMNWEGVWNNAQQYFKNDLAISPTNNATYVLFGRTTDRGVDPISNSAWFELFPHATGIHALQGSANIAVLPPSATPTVENDGIRSIVANTGLSALFPLPNEVLVFNTGILGFGNVNHPGDGITWDSSTNTLLNNGLVGTIRLGVGNTGTPQNQVLTNLGVVGLTGSPNISVVVDASQNATITNTGVRLLSAADSRVVITNSRNDPVVNARVGGQVTSVLNVLGDMSPNPLPPGVFPTPTSALLPVSLPVGSLLEQQLLAGTTDPNPYWWFDFADCWFDFGVIHPLTGIPIGVQDTTTAGGPYTYFPGTTLNGTGGSEVFQNPLWGFNSACGAGWLFASLNDMRGRNIKTINNIVINNPLGEPIRLASRPSVVQLRYYPNFTQ